jgi:hypothetical protein
VTNGGRSMQNDYEKLLINAEILEKIKLGLNEIKSASSEENIKNKAEKLLSMLNGESEKIKSISLEKEIYRKMKQTPDSDLNVKLYMLYRKLQNGKISENEALVMFESYCKSEYRDGYL